MPTPRPSGVPSAHPSARPSLRPTSNHSIRKEGTVDLNLTVGTTFVALSVVAMLAVILLAGRSFLRAYFKDPNLTVSEFVILFFASNDSHFKFNGMSKIGVTSDELDSEEGGGRQTVHFYPVSGEGDIITVALPLQETDVQAALAEVGTHENNLSAIASLLSERRSDVDNDSSSSSRRSQRMSESDEFQDASLHECVIWSSSSSSDSGDDDNMALVCPDVHAMFDYPMHHHLRDTDESSADSESTVDGTDAWKNLFAYNEKAEDIFLDDELDNELEDESSADSESTVDDSDPWKNLFAYNEKAEDIFLDDELDNELEDESLADSESTVDDGTDL
jgi:hypothetical protein